MPTAHSAVLALLRYFSPQEQTLPNATYPDRWQECVRAINTAFGEYATALGDTLLTQRRTGYLFPESSAVSVALTAGSRTATITHASTLGTDLTGRLLAFADYDIRIQRQTAYATTPAIVYTLTLSDEWPGSTGTHAATLYGDSRVLDVDVLQVVECEHSDGTALELVAGDRGALKYITSGYERLNDYGFRSTPGRELPFPRLSECTPMAPAAYSISNAAPNIDDTGTLTIYPPPTVATLIRARVLTAWFYLDLETLAASNQLVTDLQAITLPVSHAIYSQVILPIAAQHLGASANFRNDSVLPEISRQYKSALQQLRTLKKTRPRRTILRMGP